MWANNCTLTPLFFIMCQGAFIIMELTYENIEQAKKDKEQYDRYLIEMEDERPEIVRKSFKEMFGYEIILFESGGYELRGERFS